MDPINQFGKRPMQSTAVDLSNTAVDLPNKKRAYDDSFFNTRLVDDVIQFIFQKINEQCQSAKRYKSGLEHVLCVCANWYRLASQVKKNWVETYEVGPYAYNWQTFIEVINGIRSLNLKSANFTVLEKNDRYQLYNYPHAQINPDNIFEETKEAELKELYQLTHLQKLTLSSDTIIRLQLNSFTQLESLTLFSYEGFEFTEIPSLEKLKVLDLTGFCSHWFALHDVATMNLFRINASEKICPLIDNCNHLTHLKLHVGLISKHVFEKITNLKHLIHLEITDKLPDFEQLDGDEPAEKLQIDLDVFSNLKTLILYSIVHEFDFTISRPLLKLEHLAIGHYADLNLDILYYTPNVVTLALGEWLGDWLEDSYLEPIYQLMNLKSLTLHEFDVQLDHWNLDLFRLLHLEHLAIRTRPIVKFSPSPIPSLPNLRTLDLEVDVHTNDINELIHKCSNLSKLTLNLQRMRGLENSFANLSQLKSLQLIAFDIGTMNLSHLTQLKKLVLIADYIRKPFFGTFSSLTNLKQLKLISTSESEDKPLRVRANPLEKVIKPLNKLKDIDLINVEFEDNLNYLDDLKDRLLEYVEDDNELMSLDEEIDQGLDDDSDSSYDLNDADVESLNNQQFDWDADHLSGNEWMNLEDVPQENDEETNFYDLPSPLSQDNSQSYSSPYFNWNDL